ncbi:MAG TPA: nucleotide sugar dehydrogenase, partial [Candidatus Eisenbacteria bacterium]|nr:nucleotide sugar dehydrogenase [Candidatus Eisenbacteria bacterium]
MSRTPDREPMADLDLVVVGGCGHVGLPLALAFARVGCRVGIYDTDETRMATVRGGQMPFRETGADSLLVSMLASGRLEFSTTSEIVRRTATVVTVVGTPIDEFLNPSTRVFDRVVDELAPELRDGALLVLRS